MNTKKPLSTDAAQSRLCAYVTTTLEPAFVCDDFSHASSPIAPPLG
ncbi:MAG: hypothetical protein LBG65_04170 [Puniceicoccales bacterium]|nr:hypothetical protein [Puniceicoccales bacterium]